MQTLVGFAAILSWTLALSKLKPQYGNIWPVFVVTAIPTLLYLGAFAHLLMPMSMGLTYGGFMALFSVQVQQNLKGFSWRKGLTRSWLLLTILGSYWYVHTLPALATDWDDFYWAGFTKSLQATGNFYTVQSAILDQKAGYPPGMSLFQYFFIQEGPFKESALYFAQGIMIIACWSTIMGAVTWGKRLFGLFLALLFSLAYFYPDYVTLSVDHILGYLFAAGLVLAVTRTGGKNQVLYVLPLLFFLPLVKITGIVLDGSLVILFVSRWCASRTGLLKNRIPMVIGLGLVCLCGTLLWGAFIHTQKGMVRYREGFPPALQINGPRIRQTFGKELVGLRDQTVIKRFIKALYLRPLTGYPTILSMHTHGIFDKFPYFGTVVGWSVLIGGILFLGTRKRKYLLLTFGAGSVLYLLTILLVFLYVFLYTEGLNLASYERYLNTWVMAWFIVMVVCVLNLVPVKRRRGVYSICILGLIMMGLTQMPDFTILTRQVQAFNPGTRYTRRSLLVPQTEILQNTPAQSSVWLIYQQSDGFELMILRLEIAPRLTNPTLWSLGHPGSQQDQVTHYLTPTEWSALLTQYRYDYVYVGNASHDFWDTYGSLFTNLNEAKSARLFRIHQTGNGLILEPIRTQITLPPTH